MTLEQWSQNGWIQPYEPTTEGVRQLLQVVDRDLSDACTEGLSADGQFQHAYDAALQLCMIPLQASGYRPAKGQGGHHRYAIESLQLTLGEGWSETARYIERCSRLRGQAVYDRIGVVDQEAASELIETVKELRKNVVNWLKRAHPELVPMGI